MADEVKRIRAVFEADVSKYNEHYIESPLYYSESFKRVW